MRSADKLRRRAARKAKRELKLAKLEERLAARPVIDPHEHRSSSGTIVASRVDLIQHRETPPLQMPPIWGMTVRETRPLAPGGSIWAEP